jgi:hypothetical protein
MKPEDIEALKLAAKKNKEKGVIGHITHFYIDKKSNQIMSLREEISKYPLNPKNKGDTKHV